jgi:hypothetical protein
MFNALVNSICHNLQIKPFQLSFTANFVITIACAQEKWFLAAIYVAEKNTKLLQNLLMLDFVTTLYFSQ